MLMELTGVRDIIARATEWRRIGVDRIVYHREWDAHDRLGERNVRPVVVRIERLRVRGFLVHRNQLGHVMLP